MEDAFYKGELRLNGEKLWKKSRTVRVFFVFLAVLGLRCCAQAFSSCSERGLLFVAVHGLLIVLASLVVEHGL